MLEPLVREPVRMRAEDTMAPLAAALLLLLLLAPIGSCMPLSAGDGAGVRSLAYPKSLK